MKLKPIIWALLLAVLLAGCAGAAESPTAAPPPPTVVIPATATVARTPTSVATDAVVATNVPTVAMPPTEQKGQPPMNTPTDQPPSAAPTEPPSLGETRIRVIISDTVLTGRLWDTATARDLIARLPLTLTFSDYNGVEKIASLSPKLTIDGAPAGDDPLPANIGYYAPWSNLVFYYGDVGYFNGIVRIGQFDDSVDALAGQAGDFTARIELAD